MFCCEGATGRESARKGTGCTGVCCVVSGCINVCYVAVSCRWNLSSPRYEGVNHNSSCDAVIGEDARDRCQGMYPSLSRVLELARYREVGMSGSCANEERGSAGMVSCDCWSNGLLESYVSEGRDAAGMVDDIDFFFLVHIVYDDDNSLSHSSL